MNTTTKHTATRILPGIYYYRGSRIVKTQRSRLDSSWWDVKVKVDNTLYTDQALTLKAAKAFIDNTLGN